MERKLKCLLQGQSGQSVLVIVLILTLLGGLLLGPLLGYMSSGLRAGQMYESRTAELYAADAGIEYVVNKFVKQGQPQKWTGWDPNAMSWQGVLPQSVNGRSVSVSVEKAEGEFLTYDIRSTALTDGGGSTTVIARLSGTIKEFGDLLQGAITSNTTVEIKNGVYVEGDVRACSDVDVKGDVSGNVTAAGNVVVSGHVAGDVTAGGSVTISGTGSIDGRITPYAQVECLAWPSPDDFAQFYEGDVASCTPYPYASIDIAGQYTEIGPLFRDGNLKVYNSRNTPGTVNLTGTVYVTGSLEIGNQGKDFTLDLNGNVLFAKGGITIGGACNIIGTGCIVAVLDCYIAPKGDIGTEGDFVVMMSITGTTTLQPSGHFYGCAVGDVFVNIKSGTGEPYLMWTDPQGHNLRFPSKDDPIILGWSLESWEVQ